MLEKRDLNVCLPLLIVIIICSYYLSIPFPSLKTKDLKILANVVSITNNLKLKRVDSISWEDISGTKQLREGDKLFTHDNARARIRYINGVEIDIEPSTLVEIREIGGETIIDIQTGFITLSFKDAIKKVTIKAKKDSVTIDSNNSKMNVVEVNSLLAVGITKGSAKVRRKSSKKTLQLTQGEVLTDSNKILKIEDSDIITNPKKIEWFTNVVDDLPDTLFEGSPYDDINVTSPLKNALHYLYADSLEVTFSWEGGPNSSNLTISKNSNLSSPIFTDNNITKREISYSFKDLGQYYWQIDNEPVQQIKIQESPPLDSPDVSATIDLQNISKNREIYRLKWTPVQHANSYLLEIFRDPKGKRLVTRTKTKQPSTLWKADIVDTLYYRVTAIDRWNKRGKSSKIGKLVAPISPFDNINQ